MRILQKYINKLLFFHVSFNSILQARLCVFHILMFESIFLLICIWVKLAWDTMHSTFLNGVPGELHSAWLPICLIAFVFAGNIFDAKVHFDIFPWPSWLLDLGPRSKLRIFLFRHTLFAAGEFNSEVSFYFIQCLSWFLCGWLRVELGFFFNDWTFLFAVFESDTEMPFNFSWCLSWFWVITEWILLHFVSTEINFIFFWHILLPFGVRTISPIIVNSNFADNFVTP